MMRSFRYMKSRMPSLKVTVATVVCGMVLMYYMMSFLHVYTPAMKPNLNLEHNESWVECEMYKTSLFPPTTDHQWHVVLAQFSPLAFKVAQDLLEEKHNVLLIVSQGNDAQRNSIRDIMKFTKQLVLVDYDTEFLGDNFEDLVKDRTIAHIHFLFLPHDFSTVYAVNNKVGPLSKVVNVLEYASAHRNVVLLDHVQAVDNTQVPFKINHMQGELLAASPDLSKVQFHQHQIMKPPQFHHLCTLKMDYNQDYEVFLKALDTYLYTFHSLYELNMVRLIH